ncbi:MAG: hypothetical protein KGR26_08625 [Cyanobacteria bacterium REEB65]|nr:hypothetical protein [Cyanobacteria bacterium REEB65]
MPRSLPLACALSLALTSPALAQSTDRPAGAPLVSKGVFVVRPLRNPTFAAASSMFFPGGGQIYNDAPSKWLLALTLLGVTGYFGLTGSNPTAKIVSDTLFGLSWLWSIGDAYVDAKAYNDRLLNQALP